MNDGPLSQPSGRGTGWVIAQIPLLLAAIMLPVLERLSHGPES